MTAEIRELNVDDVKNVAGGVRAVSTSTSVSISKPVVTTSWSASIQVTGSAMARRY